MNHVAQDRITRGSIRIIVALVAIVALTILLLHIPPVTPIITYVTAFISSSLVYWFLAQYVLQAEASKGALTFILVLLLVVRISFLVKSPMGSDDVYRYIWDGRVQTAGVNPYRFAPNDEELRALHSENLPSLVNHAEMRTVYFPLSQWLFYLAYQLSGDQVWGIKLLILIAEILTTMGLLRLMQELSMSPWRVLIYASNPLIILQFSLDAHVDVLGFPFLIFAFLLYHRNNKTVSLFLFGLSLLIKPVALLIVPILFFLEHGYANKAKVILVPLAVMLIPFLPYVANANPFESLATFSTHWFFNGALFSVLFPLFSDSRTARIACLIVLAAILFWLSSSTKSFYRRIVLAVLFLLLCSPVAHPWYIGWLIVLLPLAPIRSGLALATTASLSSITFIAYQLQGVWKEYPLVLILEYIPVTVFLFFDLRKTEEFVSRN